MRRLIPLAVLLSFLAAAGCPNSSEESLGPVTPPGNVHEFGIYWPPQDPADPEGPVGEPFLLGKLYLDDTGPDSLTLTIDLTRPHTEEDRESWNSRLAYREYDWMRRLRIWDADKKWIWPNLPYLLRAHGAARFERYGGVDPGSGEDNDFAAVLIRAYDPANQAELSLTKDDPFVSAEWYPVGLIDVDRQSVLHTARSDTFTVPVNTMESHQHHFRVWLIYADFMGTPAPSTWPKNREWKGGALAYFDIHREKENGVTVEQATPPCDTGFDWEQWINPPSEATHQRAQPRLSM